MAIMNGTALDYAIAFYPQHCVGSVYTRIFTTFVLVWNELWEHDLQLDQAIAFNILLL